jgi:thioester reductase-like protein
VNGSDDKFGGGALYWPRVGFSLGFFDRRAIRAQSFYPHDFVHVTTAPSHPADGPVLLTGATGFIGMQLLARYLERTDRQVYVLVRAGDEFEAGARIRATVAQLVGDGDLGQRVVAVPGDVTQRGLGLDRRMRDEIAARVTEVVHSAASVSFTLPLAESREINVEGTRRLLQLAELCDGLRRFSYVSTAYVAGTHTGRFGEDDLDVLQGFRNPYEQSKFEAERLVSAHKERLPIQVFRPSIVVGEEASGWTTAFNVVYGPLRAFSAGAYAAIPARRSAPVDVVPVSYVADAILELSGRDGGAGETYNLAAGPQATTVGELIDLSARYFGRRRPLAIPPSVYRRFVHPLLLRRSGERRRRALERSEALFPYFAMRTTYDTSRAFAQLAPAGIRPRPLADYFKRIVDFAVRSDWGRRPIARTEALTAA